MSKATFLCTTGEINDDVVKGLFSSFDSNGDGSIDESGCPLHKYEEPDLARCFMTL